MKKFLLFITLFPMLWITSGVSAATRVPLAEAVIYVDHGCTDDASLDQCLRIDWIKDQTFTWQWYQGENQDKKIISSVDREDILETLEEIFGNDRFDKERLDAGLKDSNARQDWFRSLMTADQTALEDQLALDPERVEIKADSPCTEKSIYRCPSRRIEFMALGAVTDSESSGTGQPAASLGMPAADSADSETELPGNDQPGPQKPSASTAVGKWWLPGILLALLAGVIGLLGFLVRKLLQQSSRQYSLLKDLASYTLDSLQKISVALNADESHDATDSTERVSNAGGGLAPEGDLISAFSEVLAPAVKDATTARLYLSLQDKLFHSIQDEQARADLVRVTRENLSDLLPEIHHASTLEEMKTALGQQEQNQTELDAESEQALRNAVNQLVKNQEDLTRQTQLAFSRLQKTLDRLDTALKTR